jgi:TRAP-type mannitol/chloroaromatic compound transport system substrate-binding protein
MSKKYYVFVSLGIVILALVIYKLFFIQSPGKAVTFKWKIYSVYPDRNPIYKDGLEKFAEDVKRMTNGQIIIEYIPFGEEENKDPNKVFEAVSSGKVEMGFGSSLYWVEEKDKDRISGRHLMYAIPFGLNASNMYEWLNQKGGLELFKDIYVPFNVIPLPIGDTGGSMGGWFREEINTIDDFKGLRIRDIGLPTKVWEKLGAKAQWIPASGVLDAYEKKLIDAIVALGPHSDKKYNLYKGPQYYYYPGWQEPCGLLSLIINKSKWDQLPENFKKIIEMACDSTYHYILDRFNTSNSTALLELKKLEKVKFREFPPAILDKLREYTKDILEEEAGKSKQFAEIYQSFKKFKESKPDSPWDKIVEEAVYSDTTVLKFKEELANSTVARVYQRGNKNVVISLFGNVSFGPNSAAPSKTLINEIPVIAKIINDNSISIKAIMVEGYSDIKSDPVKNLNLSMDRANRVIDLLTKNGINDSLIRPVFYGDTFTITDNKNPDNRLTKRGVEITIEF